MAFVDKHVVREEAAQQAMKVAGGRGEKGWMEEVVDLQDDGWGSEGDMAGEIVSLVAILGIAVEGAEEEIDRRLVSERHDTVQQRVGSLGEAARDEAHAAQAAAGLHEVEPGHMVGFSWL